MSDENNSGQETEAPQDTVDATAEATEHPLSADEIVAGLQAELAASKDQTLRALAEAENARKRAERQVSEARVFAIDRFARDLLAVADNLSRAITTISAEARAGLTGEGLALLEGVELTEKSLVTGFERHGLKQINQAGIAFDPNIHEAVAQIPSSEAAGRVAQIFQPGWRLADRTLRPAMVAVSLGPVSAAPAPTPNPESNPTPGSIVDQQA
ncbi:MAG: nucleotide exchange factor GrpE [Caulobacterales bacterium]